MTSFGELVSASRQVASRSSRRHKVEALSQLLAACEPDEIGIATCFLTGRLPQGRIGIGAALLRDVEATTPPAAESTLALREVSAAFDEIAATVGAGSRARRLERLHRLFAQATADEQDFLFRLCLSDLRQGALTGVMVEAVAQTTGIPAVEIRRRVMLAGDLQAVSEVALVEGESGLARFELEVGRPVQSMLAQPVADLEAALERMQGRKSPPRLEAKIDGARVQVHRDDERVAVFSRRLHDVTRSVPEIVDLALQLPARRLILDGETFVERGDGSPRSFQTTMRRFGRKLDVEKSRRELPLVVRFFDCLLVDESSIIERPARERWRELERLVPPGQRMPSVHTHDPEQAADFLEQTLQDGHEGVMVKDPESPYEAGSRGWSWLKVKPAHTLDLVVLAAEWGHGRRQGKLSNLHLGALDPSQEGGPYAPGFAMLGKTFKGLTDRILAWQTEKLLAAETGRDGHTVFVRPEQVVEIAFNDLQRSPSYPAGLALRFARVKAYRKDKKPSEADTLETVRRLFDERRDGAAKARERKPPPVS